MRTDLEQIEWLSRENKSLKAQLSGAQEANYIYSCRDAEAIRRRKELQQAIQQKDEQLVQKQEEVEKLQEEMGRMKLWSQNVPGPVCHICKFEYNAQRVPKVLHCGHTLCVTCVEQLDKIWSITCPFCRVERIYNRPNMSGGTPTIPTNFQLVEVMEANNQQRYSPLSYSDTLLHDVFLAVVAPVTICYLVLKN